MIYNHQEIQHLFCSYTILYGNTKYFVSLFCMEILYGDGVFACLLQMYRWMNGWVDGRIDLKFTSISSTNHVGWPVGQSVTQWYF